MDNIRNGFKWGCLESLKINASYLLKDSLKIARLALVDVSNAELMTEEATNADEWGPTTTQMAEISRSINNSEDYLRIVHVLHDRFALNIQKFWRQIHKSLLLLEYLLCHGPEDLVMEFRQDKSRIEEFTCFVYVDLNEIDRGSAVRRRAKHVLHVLMDESFYKKERIRAQKISSGISGFGNGSAHDQDHDHHHHHHHQSTHSKFLPSSVPRSQSASSLSENRLGAGGSISLLRGDDEDHVNSKPDARESCRSAHAPEGDFCSPSASDASSWKTFSGSSGVESASTSGCSESSTYSNVSTKKESPTHLSLFPRTTQILDMDSVASGLENNSRTPSLQRLPPPPLIAEYKGVKPQAPRVQRKLPPKSLGNDHGNDPDLISI